MSIDYELVARHIRINIIKSVYAAQSGHPGGSLSAVEILTVLYFYKMNIDPENPKMPDRDKFILSKGHATPLLYSVLAERGFFPKKELLTFRKIGSLLQGHPDMEKVNGVEMSTGSLGQGFSAAGGIALAGKLDKSKGNVYVLLGDGELQEGIVWEAAMSAAHYNLSNLTAIIDWNGLQIDGKNETVMNVLPIDEKFKAFGWETKIIDGHNFEEIKEALDWATEKREKPQAIIAKTIKGKGVSYMEDDYKWHGKAPDKELAKKALEELGGNFDDFN